MAKRHAGLPKPPQKIIEKAALLKTLLLIDKDQEATDRVLNMETDFRSSMSNHVDFLPKEDAVFKKFNTNPFVLMIHCLNRGYHKISEIEKDILPAKEFSSMETSAGRMTEKGVALI